jgi:hypothetical protein
MDSRLRGNDTNLMAVDLRVGLKSKQGNDPTDALPVVSASYTGLPYLLTKNQ